MRTSLGTAVGVVLLLSVAGCSGSPDPVASVASSPARSTGGAGGPSLPPDLDQFTPAPTGVVDEDTGQTVGSQPVPTWDAAARAAAVNAAKAALTAFARPRLDHDTWWAGLEPLLTPEAAQDYAYVDPANVPVTAVTGPGRLIDSTSAYVAHVAFTTDAGTYTVVVSRADGAAPWLTSRITPPQND